MEDLQVFWGLGQNGQNVWTPEIEQRKNIKEDPGNRFISSRSCLQLPSHDRVCVNWIGMVYSLAMFDMFDVPSGNLLRSY